MDEEVLKKYAEDLRNTRKNYERVFICYFLPGMQIDAAARAMRERVFSAKDIATAQKILLNPARGAREILAGLDFDSYLGEIEIPVPPKPQDFPNRPLEENL